MGSVSQGLRAHKAALEDQFHMMDQDCTQHEQTGESVLGHLIPIIIIPLMLFSAKESLPSAHAPNCAQYFEKCLKMDRTNLENFLKH